MDLVHEAANGVFMDCYAAPDSAYLHFATLNRAEELWQAAEAAVADEPELLWRVQQGHLAVRYAFLANWAALRQECESAGLTWPLPDSRQSVAEEWLAVATGPGPQRWKPMTHVNEGAVTPQAFIESLR
jgi:hypothetical protein